MRVVLEQDPMRRSMKVWLLPSDDLVVRQDPDGTWSFEPFAFGDSPEPSLVLPSQWFEALVREALASGGVPEPDALADARKMRDRLMAMVESAWNARTEDSA